MREPWMDAEDDADRRRDRIDPMHTARAMFNGLWMGALAWLVVIVAGVFIAWLVTR